MLQLGENDEAHQYAAIALRLSAEHEIPGQGLAWALIGEIELRRGNLEQALEYSRQYLIVAYEAPTPVNVLERLETMAKIFAAGGRPHDAARLSGAAEVWSERHNRSTSSQASSETWEGNYNLRYSDVELDALVPDWQTRPDGKSIRQAWDEGRAMGYDQAVAFALSLSLAAPAGS